MSRLVRSYHTSAEVLGDPRISVLIRRVSGLPAGVTAFVDDDGTTATVRRVSGRLVSADVREAEGAGAFGSREGAVQGIAGKRAEVGGVHSEMKTALQAMYARIIFVGI